MLCFDCFLQHIAQTFAREDGMIPYLSVVSQNSCISFLLSLHVNSYLCFAISDNVIFVPSSLDTVLLLWFVPCLSPASVVFHVRCGHSARRFSPSGVYCLTGNYWYGERLTTWLTCTTSTAIHSDWRCCVHNYSLALLFVQFALLRLIRLYCMKWCKRFCIFLQK